MHLKVILPIISEMSSMYCSVHFFTYFITLSPHEGFAREVFVKTFDRCKIWGPEKFRDLSKSANC